LIRKYLPKSKDLSINSQEHLDANANEINGWPKKASGYVLAFYRELLINNQQT
jgi:IS30 family transposase